MRRRASGRAADDFIFLVVGEGPEAEKLQGRSRDLSLGGAVRFMGRRDDIPGDTRRGGRVGALLSPGRRDLSARRSRGDVVRSARRRDRRRRGAGDDRGRRGRAHHSAGGCGALAEALVALADAPEREKTDGDARARSSRAGFHGGRHGRAVRGDVRRGSREIG